MLPMDRDRTGFEMRYKDTERQDRGVGRKFTVDGHGVPNSRTTEYIRVDAIGRRMDRTRRFSNTDFYYAIFANASGLPPTERPEGHRAATNGAIASWICGVKSLSPMAMPTRKPSKY